jgi:hypothetical protein
MNTQYLEENTLFKQPKKGKCKDSTFKNGWHRVGFLPKTCPNDGALKGMSCQEVCLDCGKEFKKSIFVI